MKNQFSLGFPARSRSASQSVIVHWYLRRKISRALIRQRGSMYASRGPFIALPRAMIFMNLFTRSRFNEGMIVTWSRRVNERVSSRSSDLWFFRVNASRANWKRNCAFNLLENTVYCYFKATSQDHASKIKDIQLLVTET